MGDSGAKAQYRAALCKAAVLVEMVAGLFVSPSAALAADVEITSNRANLDLDAQSGTTAHIAAGITVGSTALPGGGVVAATLQPWLLSNEGTVTGSGTVLRFLKGGSVTNAVGAFVTGANTALQFGTSADGGVGTLTNAGTISSTSTGDTVLLYGGGSVTNLVGATISANNSSNAVSISGGTSRTVTNSGTITNTGASFSTGVLVQGAGATNTITNNAGGSIHGGYNGVYASATASVSLGNAGSITSDRGSAVEATAGGTITNSGTIANGGLGSAGSNNGITVRNTASAEVINSGTITGGVAAINFTASGGGSVGATHIVRLRTGSVLNGSVLGGTGTDQLILEGSGSESIAKFQNFETLSAQGTDWTLTDAGTFATSAEVQSGILRVTGMLTSPDVAVRAVGTLAGTGTIAGNVSNAGTVATGTGVLTVAGNYVQQAGSTLSVGVTPSLAGLLAVSGLGHSATLQGGTVAVQAVPGSYGASTTYTILTATGGVSGSFGTVTSSLAYLAPTLSYDASNVYLTLTRNAVDFAAIAATRNQRAAAGAVETLGSGNPLFDAVVPLDAAAARAAFDAVSGEIHASERTALIEDSRLLRDAILGRLGGTGAPTGTIVGDGLTLWGQAYGAGGHSAGDGNAARLGRSGGGVIVGLDGSVAEAWRAGIVAGYGRSRFDVDGRASEGDSDNYHLAVYGGGGWGALALRAGLAQTWHDVDVSRTIVLTGLNDRTRSNGDATTTQLFAELGRPFALGAATIEPFGNLALVRVRTSAVTETGGPAALSVATGSDTVTLATLGLHGATSLPLGGAMVTARGTLGWRHAFGALTPTADVAFAGQAPFSVAGVPVAANAFVADAALDIAVGPGATLGVLVGGQAGNGAVDGSVRATATLRF